MRKLRASKLEIQRAVEPFHATKKGRLYGTVKVPHTEKNTAALKALIKEFNSDIGDLQYLYDQYGDFLCALTRTHDIEMTERDKSALVTLSNLIKEKSSLTVEKITQTKGANAGILDEIIGRLNAIGKRYKDMQETYLGQATNVEGDLDKELDSIKEVLQNEYETVLRDVSRAQDHYTKRRDRLSQLVSEQKKGNPLAQEDLEFLERVNDKEIARLKSVFDTSLKQYNKILGKVAQMFETLFNHIIQTAEQKGSPLEKRELTDFKLYSQNMKLLELDTTSDYGTIEQHKLDVFGGILLNMSNIISFVLGRKEKYRRQDYGTLLKERSTDPGYY
jgi:ferritin